MEGVNKMKNFKEPHIVKCERRMFNEPPKESNVAYIGSPFDGTMVRIDFNYVKSPRIKKDKKKK